MQWQPAVFAGGFALRQLASHNVSFQLSIIS